MLQSATVRFLRRSCTGSSQNRFHPFVTRTLSTANPGNGVFPKIACLGGGMMARAMMEPMIASELQPAGAVQVYDVNVSTMELLEKELGVLSSSSSAECVADADLILCAVKPQNLKPAFYAEFVHAVKPGAIFLSVIAGKPIATYQEEGGFSKIVRSMPNTPATIGQGMTVWSATPNLTTEERTKIKQVLSSCGQSMYVDDESFIDMATSISGSGPAYIFLLMESMIDGAVHMGLPREKAATLVYHTMLGSTLYAIESKQHPAILRNRVTSPAGTTASALHVLETGTGTLKGIITKAMWSCYRRSLEIGDKPSDVGPGRSATNFVLRTDDLEDLNSKND